MRFLELDLLRYGALTDRRLAFRPDARLHVVYGPNEAGKSSILSGIADLLFGFPQRRAYDFLHDAADLRVGALIERRDGQRLAFRRRRGTKNTLLSADDDAAPLPSDVLLPFVGRIDRGMFTRAFGLDSEGLVKGGEAMLEDGGELGATLFAAASGLSGLADLRKSLDGEAEGIFARTRAGHRTLYQALDRYEQARRAERDGELKARDWEELVEATAAIETELAGIRQAREDNARAVRRLERLSRLRPLLLALDEAESANEAFAGLPPAEPGFADVLEASLDAAAAARAQVEALAGEIAAARAELAGRSVDEALVAAAAEVTALFAQKGDYQSKRRDQPAIARERDEYVHRLEHHYQRLGRPPEPSGQEVLPPDAALAALQDLVARGRGLDQRLAALEHERAEEEEQAQALDRDLPAQGLIDPRPWRAQFAALEPDLAGLARVAELETRQAQLQRRFAEAAARLDPPLPDPQGVDRADLPGEAALRRHAERLESLGEGLRSAREARAGLARRLAETAGALAETEARGKPVTPEAIAAIRAERDAILADLAAGPATAQRFAALASAIAAADGLADQAWRDAERIARHLQLRQLLEQDQRAADELDARIAGLEAEHEAAQEAFTALFAAAGITPSPPSAMIAWLPAVEALLALRAEIAELGGARCSLERAAETLRPALLSIGEAAGFAAPALPVPALARGVRARLDELAAAWADRQGLRGRREAAAQRLERLAGALEACHADRAAWQEDFAAQLRILGLPATLGLVEAEAALQVLGAIPDLIDQRDNRARRVAGMERDIAAFETAAARLCERLAPELAALSPAAAVDALQERTQAALTAQSLRRQAEARIAELSARLLAAEKTLSACTADAEGLAARLGTDGDLRAQIAAIRARDEAAMRLREARARLLQQAEGEDEAAVRAGLADCDPEQLAFQLEDLAREAEALGAENDRLYAELGQKRHERARYEAGMGAELAAFERQAAAAEIQAEARRYAVLKIAATLLGTAMDRHREAQADPMLLRAGSLFAALTDGAFSALRQDFDDGDKPRLLAVRTGGAPVAVEGLSDGTRDQLYLALRLAYLEDYAAEAEAMPLIADDLFQTFDDRRAAAGLRTLAATAGHFQTILFTHQASIVDIARRELGAEADIILL